ncbi:hypothetical protein BC828DRAFT_391463 [Blastocladiella britannica]|nr:hypothetical protein BC828DRAFT_391463 [Blastocladiella britannica]
MSRILGRIFSGPRLEVAKFGFYVFTPMLTMYFTGIPDFLENQVEPLRRKLFRLNDQTYHPPTASEDIQEYMEALRTRKDRIAAATAANASASHDLAVREEESGSPSSTA